MNCARHLSCPSDTLHKSIQAALDSSSSIDSPGFSPRKTKVLSRELRHAYAQARETPANNDVRADRSDTDAPTALRFGDTDAVRSSISF